MDVGLAVDAGEARPAAAGVGVDVVGAGARVLTGAALALVHLLGTAGPREAGQAAAAERVDAVRTGAPAQAGVWGGREGGRQRERETETERGRETGRETGREVRVER